jgi:hypothetical protein
MEYKESAILCERARRMSFEHPGELNNAAKVELYHSPRRERKGELLAASLLRAFSLPPLACRQGCQPQRAGPSPGESSGGILHTASLLQRISCRSELFRRKLFLPSARPASIGGLSTRDSQQ